LALVVHPAAVLVGGYRKLEAEIQVGNTILRHNVVCVLRNHDG
jgi:hypothetical protein